MVSHLQASIHYGFKKGLFKIKFMVFVYINSRGKIKTLRSCRMIKKLLKLMKITPLASCGGPQSF